MGISKNISKFILFTILMVNFVVILYSQPSSKPILTLNTMMHISFLNTIDADNEGKYILTCSNDKTGKLWNANTGDLIRTYRIPIGEGNEGMPYSCAISPDGTIAAFGGWTGWSWDETHNIYLFNASTGEMIGRLADLENVVFDLEFSKDGKYLAAALAEANGVRVYDVETWKLYKKLDGYGDNSYVVAFDNHHRLATVCYDGRIRLYDNTFQLIKEKKTNAGKKLFSLAFSPDGTKLAVGYYDSPEIEILDANNLSLLYKPDISSANTVDKKLNKVSFSFDGKHLYAGGFYEAYNDKDWRFQIRRWNNAGRGSYVDFPACKNTIVDIKPLPSGDIIFCGSYPDFGRMKHDGKMVFYQSAGTNSFAGSDKTHFLIDDLGTKVGFTPYGGSAHSFDAPQRMLSESASDGLPSIDAVKGIIVTDWKHSYSPKLNGNQLTFLEENEPCRCVDIDGNTNEIVFGAESNIYRIDAFGNKQWQIPVQEVAWAVNISGNGKIVVSALADGTIRWYRMTDGKELLSLFIHSDLERWILWTPSGYYDCSPGGEDLIGWHVNNGLDQAADYYPVSKFRSIYYRPDIIDKVLQAYDEDEAVRLANEESNRQQQIRDIKGILPPYVTIVKPLNGDEFASTSVTFSYFINSPNNEEIVGVKAYLNGRFLKTIQAVHSIGVKKEVTLTLPGYDCTVSLIAQNRFGYSDPTGIDLIWKGKSNWKETPKPNLYILAVGVGAYKKKEYSLSFPGKDAKDFVAAIKKQKGLLYENIIEKILSDDDATKDNILDAMEWLKTQTTNRDVAMMFFAGHGIKDNTGVFYFLPVGADIESIRRTCVNYAEIQQIVSSISGKMILFVDACHSGIVLGSPRSVPDINAIVNDLVSAENGVVTFTSSTGKQFSLEDKKWNNGAFTKALVEGLEGKAIYRDERKITIMSLGKYVSERVKELTNGQQSPTAIVPNGVTDFPIAIIK